MNRVALPDEVGEFEEVLVETLDFICDGVDPSIIKIDVEGHELAVLKGGSAVLRKPSLTAVLLETNRSGAKFGVEDALLFDEMEKYEFRPYKYDALSRTIGDSTLGSVNTIFVRDREVVQEVCRSARRFTLCNGTV